MFDKVPRMVQCENKKDYGYEVIKLYVEEHYTSHYERCNLAIRGTTPYEAREVTLKGASSNMFLKPHTHIRKFNNDSTLTSDDSDQ